MADRRKGSRMMINRAAADQLNLIIADGLLAVGTTLIQETQPPDAPPLGEGLVRHGGVVVYLGGKKVGQYSTDGSNVPKPRAIKAKEFEIQAGVGFPHPARWDELGTVHQPARPFFWPRVQRIVPRIPGIMRATVSQRLGSGHAK